MTMVQHPALQRLTQLYEQHGTRLPPLVLLLLMILCGRLLAQLLWALWPLPDSARWQPPAISQAAAPVNRQINVQALADRHLFGNYQAVAGQNAADAPETRLSLTLLGILASGKETDSRALIGSSDGEEKPYAISDEVIHGVTLQAIFADRVVLSRDGVLETLRLEKDAPITGSGAAVDGSGDNGSTLNRIRNEILLDPSKAAQYIRIQPANVNGQMKGFRIYPGREREAFNDLGLRPGDLVTSVNGIQLDDTQKALQMLGDLSKAGAVTVTVERGGQSQTLNVNFN